MVLEHHGEPDLVQDISRARIPAIRIHVLVYEGGRRVRVATGQQQLHAPRGCGPPPCRPTGLAELTELLEPLFGLVEAAAPHECPQHRVPAPGGLDR